MPTILERDLLEFQRAASAGDISTQTYDRIVREATVDAMTTPERIVYEETKARHETEDQQNLIRLRLARDGGDSLSNLVLQQKDANPTIKELREVSLAGDWDRLFQLIPYFSWGFKDAPLTAGQAFPLGKFRFHWQNGKPNYVPFTEQDLLAYVTPQRVHSQPITYRCPPEQYAAIARSLFEQQQESARKYPASDWRHVLPIYPRSLLCRRPEESLWMKIRYPVLIAAGIVAAIYLGPAVMDKIGSLFPSSGTSAATTAATEGASKATLFSRIKSGIDPILSYVNKARTIEAIAKGELPPPPIGIEGASFREWVMIVAKKEITDAVKEKAAELGMEYIQKKLTEKEESKLRAEIAAMQRELENLVGTNAPMQPEPGLSPDIQGMMVGEKAKSTELNNVFAVAIPLGIGAFLLMAG